MSTHSSELASHTALVVAAPSGAGKTTLIRRALETHPDWTFSISATTRPRREHEVDGGDYYFLTRPEFVQRVENGEFLEYAEVYGNLYGTLVSEFDRAAAAGKHLLIEVDSVGSLSIRALRPEIPLLAIIPPSLEALRQRLSDRGTESTGEIALRFENAWVEMARMRAFDFVILNDDLYKAARELSNLLSVIEAGNTEVARSIDRVMERKQETTR